MAGPWERYQQPAGPWTRYAKSAPKPAEPKGVQPPPQQARPAPAVRKPTQRRVENRAGGIVGRGIVRGLTGTLDMLHEGSRLLPTMGLWRMATENLPGLRTVADAYLTQQGVAAPQTRGERIASDVTEAVTGNVATLGVGAATNARILKSNPLVQLAGSTAGAGAAGEARERGANPLVQTAVGIAGALAPGGVRYAIPAAVRGALRGGEAGRQRVARNIADFEAAGTTPTVGQATEGRVHRALESLLSRVPGSAGVIARKGEQQAEEIGARIQELGDQLAPGATAETAGRAILRGIKGDAPDSFTNRTTATANRLYSALDRAVPPGTPVPVTNVLGALDELNRPIAGASTLSEELRNPKLTRIQQALATDAADGTLPYEGLRELRTQVGRKTSQGVFNPDASAQDWNRLYGGLSDDLRKAAELSGPEASRAYNRANRYYRAAKDRSESIAHIVNKDSPEARFEAATQGTKEGATVLRALLRSLPEGSQKEVAAAVLRRMGRATAGHQGADGDTFSVQTFLTNWNKLSPQARSALFDRFGPEFRRQVEGIARTADNLRAGSKVYANPSGTGAATAQMLGLGSLGGALFGGQYGTAASLAAAGVGANLLARLMVNPSSAKRLAQKTSVPEGVVVPLSETERRRLRKKAD